MMNRWEYKWAWIAYENDPADPTPEQQLNTLGSEGWELVLDVPSAQGGEVHGCFGRSMVFKRARP